MNQVVTDQELSDLARDIAAKLGASGLKIAAAESCTGGWVAKLMTEVAGSSGWFDRGFVTYSNEAKQEMLSVAPEIIENFGAVSSEVVASMTQGALANSHADWALSISGVAGPDGGTKEKPVGTVWFAWQARGADPQTEVIQFAGDRDTVRRAACVHAMQGFLDRLK